MGFASDLHGARARVPRLTEKRACILRALEAQPLDCLTLAAAVRETCWQIRDTLDNLQAAGLTRLTDGLHALTDAGHAALRDHDRALAARREA